VVGPQAFGLPIRQETDLVAGFAAANPRWPACRSVVRGEIPVSHAPRDEIRDEIQPPRDEIRDKIPGKPSAGQGAV
jgi:hypothetical protein